MLELYTIGHSNHSAGRLLELVRANAIEAIVDVRSSPFSRYLPHFNRESLARFLSGQVRYAWMGDSLGGRPTDPRFYDAGGHALYGPLSRSTAFLAGIETIERNAGRYRMALLCSEADPTACHRFLLVTRTLRTRGMPGAAIRHILGDGSTRTETELAIQEHMLEDAWRSPLSVLHEPALSPSSGA